MKKSALLTVCFVTVVSAFSQEIDITGKNISIVDGTVATTKNNDTFFGEQVSSSGSISKTFTIYNTGSSNLTLGALTSSNPDFTITSFPVSPVLPGDSTTFTVNFNPSTNATITSTLNLVNNDATENPYNFNVSGLGLASRTVRWVNNSSGSRPATVVVGGITYNTAPVTYGSINSAIVAAGAYDIVYVTNGRYVNPNSISNTNCNFAGAPPTHDTSYYININNKSNLIITSETGDWQTSSAKLVGYGFNLMGFSVGSNITIQGFTLDSVRANGFWNSNCCNFEEVLDVKIFRNRVMNTRGHGLKTDSWGSPGPITDKGGWEIVGNRFENIGFYNGNGFCPTPAPVTALWIAEAGSSFYIVNNTIINTKWAGILCDGFGSSSSPDNGAVTIRGNIINQTVDAGIQIGFSSGGFYMPKNAYISENIVTNANTSQKVGIGAITILSSPMAGVKIMNNHLANSFNGLAIGIAGWTDSPDTTIVKYNNFCNLDGFAVTHRAGIAPNGTFGTGDDLFKKKFANNYWGDATGPTYPTNPGGLGEPLRKDTITLGAGTYSLNNFNFTPVSTAPFQIAGANVCNCPTNLVMTVSACSSYTWAANSATYTTSGTYNATLTNVFGCDSIVTLNLTVVPQPTVANAGPDQIGAFTCGTTSTTLVGNTPTVGTGTWTIVSGTGGTITTPSSAISSFSGTAGTTYTLRWTISNSPCTSSFDDVVITFNENSTVANAGSNQTGASTCGTTSTTLAGNTPTVGTGTWTIVSGTGGTITTPSSATSSFSGTAGTTYILRWTISNSPCNSSFDDVVITFNENPTVANAGSDQTGASTCGTTSTTLVGNTPTVGTGTWTIVSGTGGTITTPSSAISAFSGTAGTTYTLRWTISNSPCNSSFDDVVITFYENSTVANAGSDQTGASTCGTTSTTLVGNTPTVGTGTWTIISGTGGTITTPSSATSSFSGTAGTTYILRWTISNSPCNSSFDDVVITFNENSTVANAGSDQTGASTCGTTSTTLAGNTPTVGTGTWTIVSGIGGTITTPSSATSSFSGTVGTTYTLRWTITNSPCNSSFDDVVITFNESLTVANAGSDQTGASTCGTTSTTLAGNTPTVGTGTWTIISGIGGTITTPSSATSSFSGTAGTTYTLRWTISNSPCTPSFDDVVITFNENPTVANAGSDQNVCSSLVSASLSANTPVVGTGTWTQVSGPTATIVSASSPTTSITGLTTAGTYVFQWNIANSPCVTSTDEVTLNVITAPVADAPSNVTACDIYTLPALTVGNYYTGVNGTGTMLTAGTNITTTQTLHVYAETGTVPNCFDDNPFTVTINTTPTADSPSNVTACDSYALPALTVGNYYTGVNGTGTMLTAGTNITTTQTLHVYAETGTVPNCFDDNTFTVTINTTPVADAPSNVTACDSYTLPALTVGNYYTGVNGTGTMLTAGTNITTTQTLHVYAETGTVPNCFDDNTFTVTINTTPVADAPSNITACDSYTLPALTVGNYFTGAGGTGTALNAGDVITSTQTIFVYAETGTIPNCSDENSFTVTINTVNLGVTNTSPTLTAQATGATYVWIDCNNGNTPIAGETSQAFTATVNGSYAVIVTENGCTDTSVCELVVNVGVEVNNEDTPVFVYPNPGRDVFNVNIPALSQVYVTNALGQILYYQTLQIGVHQIDLADKAQGVYFLNIVTQKKTQTIKLVKKN